MGRTAVRRAAHSVAATAALAALLSGCGTQTGDGSDAAADPTVATPSDEPTTETPETPSPTPSATTSSPAAQETADTTTERGTGIVGSLLPAAKLPGFNEDFAWTVAETRRKEGEPLAGTCHKFELLSIGGWKLARRLYEPAVESPSSASQTIVSFPDEKTAKRAYAVLDSWRKKCAAPGRTVGELTAVKLPGATGGWYLVTEGETFDAQGFARKGDKIVVLSMATEGQDYNYPKGKEPMVTALKRAVARVS